MKNLWNKISSFVIENGGYIYMACILLVVFGSLLFVNHVNYKADLLKEKTEKSILLLQLEQYKFQAKETDEAFDWQWGIIKDQRNQLEESEKIIRNQDAALRDLIRYLKETNQWPPKIKPVDPDTLASNEKTI